MARKVKTKKKKISIINDEFMKWFIKARFEAMKPKLPHEYTGKLYSIILNYDKWHKEKYKGISYARISPVSKGRT